MVNIEPGSPILANVLSKLIKEIKTEFRRRDNPYNKNGLGSIADNISLNSLDLHGNKISAI